jgi:hypothetical protein
MIGTAWLPSSQRLLPGAMNFIRRERSSLVNEKHADFDAALADAFAWRNNAKLLLAMHQSEHG